MKRKDLAAAYKRLVATSDKRGDKEALKLKWRILEGGRRKPHPGMKKTKVARALKETWDQTKSAVKKQYGKSYSDIVKESWR